MDWIADFIRRNFSELLILDFALAWLTGAPRGHTLSGNAWRTEQAGKPWGRFWRPRIDGMFRNVFGQLDHCRKAYEREAQAIAAGAPFGICNLPTRATELIA
jgi:hypothetical protein